MADVDVSVVIVSYNTAALTERCIDSLMTEVRDATFEVIVLDNASSDGSSERIRTRFPGVRLMTSPTNVGFARGVNLAASVANGEFLLLLNPDTEVLGGAVQSLVAFARAHPRHGIYGGRTFAPDGSVDPRSCWGRPTLWSFFCFASGLRTAFARSPLFDPESLGRWERDSVREVPVVTGCLCLVHRDVWRQLGGFDPRYFMYGEDTDLCLRAGSLGWRPVITPTAEITHVVGASSATRLDKKIMVMRGKATLARRHFPGVRARIAVTLLAAGAALRGLAPTLGRASESRTSWREVWRRRADWVDGYPEFVGDRA